MAYVFQDIVKRGTLPSFLAKSVEDARNWYRARAMEMKTRPDKLVKQRGFMERTVSPDQMEVGLMYMYFYDPKHKDKLPYYDRFPLIFMIEKYDNGFLGINLHYLPHVLRARLMDQLYTIAEKNKDNSLRLQISYGILKSAVRFKYFKPCVKRYLTNHIQSGIYNVHSENWDKALMLPLQRFTKASATKVWQDSVNSVK